MPDYLLLANAAAGSTEDDAVEVARSALSAAGEVEIARTSTTEKLASVVAGLGERVLVVAGGDGSVHAAVDALSRAAMLEIDRPIGIVPLGTGNDLARSLELPLDPEQAALVVISGHAQLLDLIDDDAGGVVVNAVHVGIGAEAAERAADWKDRLGSAAYAAGAVVAGATETGWDLRVMVDGEVVAEQRVLMVGLGNGASIGGGTLIAPSADPSDGLMDVVVSSATGPLARLGYAAALREGRHVDRDDVLVLRGSSVTVEGDPFPVNADGELSGPFTRRTWRVRARSWSVLVP